MLKKTSLFFLCVSICSCATVKEPSLTIPSSQIIEKPATATTKEPTATYTIRKGDSLWSIAKKYSISIDSLRAANRTLNPHNLEIGQKINIPTKPAVTNVGFLWPVEGKIINFFGENIDGLSNNGINIAVNSDNINVKAAASGTVVFANKLNGWGTTIILKHYPNTYTIYANLDEHTVKEGQKVNKGNNIAKIAAGKNGNYVLHFEIREKSVPHNPLSYFN